MLGNIIVGIIVVIVVLATITAFWLEYGGKDESPKECDTKK